MDVLLDNAVFKLRLGLLWGQIFFQLGKDEIVSIIWVSVYVEWMNNMLVQVFWENSSIVQCQIEIGTNVIHNMGFGTALFKTFHRGEK